MAISSKTIGVNNIRSDPKPDSLLPNFQNYKLILKKHKHLLRQSHSHITRSYLSKDESDTSYQAWALHPTAKEKIGVGVDSTFVQDTIVYDPQSYTFHVRRVDKTEEDFNYRCCFGNNRNDGKHNTHER